jgi:hypothetical protein
LAATIVLNSRRPEVKVNIVSRLPWAAFALVVALAAPACSGGKDRSAEGGPDRAESSDRQGHESSNPIAALVPIKKEQGIVAQRGFSIGPLASMGRYVFWEAAGDEGQRDVVLLERDLKTGATRILAHGVSPALGIATTPDTVVFAAQSATGTHLVGMDSAGGHRHVLSRSLIAPFDARGDMVAWPEGDTVRQRVIVRNMRTGRQFVAMAGARCRGPRCYRIDRVTVASKGVVFDLGSVGQGYPSLVGRRRWDATKTSFIEIANDPQPDLVRSSSGALFYRLRHGWMEWNFDEDRPHVTSVRETRPWLLAAQGGHRLVLTGGACNPQVGLIRAGGRIAVFPAPDSTPASPTQFGALCRQLTGIAWTGNRLLLAWSFAPKISLESHSEAGLSGMITAARMH